MNADTASEKNFISEYMNLTGASEHSAQCVYMFQDVINARHESACGAAESPESPDDVSSRGGAGMPPSAGKAT